MTSPKSYSVQPVARSEIRDFIEQYHYSHNINGLKSNYCFALYDGEAMIGAMIYGTMAMAGQWKKYTVDETTTQDDVLELRRLVLVDDTVRNAETFFIATTLRWLKKHTEAH